MAQLAVLFPMEQRSLGTYITHVGLVAFSTYTVKNCPSTVQRVPICMHQNLISILRSRLDPHFQSLLHPKLIH